jgi:hypothetical protein
VKEHNVPRKKVRKKKINILKLRYESRKPYRRLPRAVGNPP